MKHITAAERGKIEAFLQQNFTPSEIAKEINKDKSTIYREMNLRSTPNGYFAKYAQVHYEASRKRCSWVGKISHSTTRNYIIERITWGWSPEQIAGRMELEKSSDRVCAETIYKFLYTDSYCIEQRLHQYLRYGKKKRSKKTGRGVRRSKIPNRVSIHQRPEKVQERRIYGHCEGDSVIYPNKKAIATFNELKTGLVELRKLERRTAGNMARAAIESMTKLGGLTLTVDNGMEFARHEDITRETKVEVYFADPYSSFQRGANENVNMLLRGYLPKRCNIDEVSQEELEEISVELNNRPRKRLNYLTPAEAYQQLINPP